MPLAVVTGAAGGIGAVLVTRLVSAGFSVAAWDRAFPQPSTDQRVDHYEVDVTDEGSVADAVDNLHGIPELLVNCAAVLQPGPLWDITHEAWKRTVAVNLDGTFLVSRAIGRHMATTGGGAIVNIASINGAVVIPSAGAYTVSKAAVLRLTEQMALEWASQGIRVNAVSPGFIDAGMNRAIVDVPEVRAARINQVPLGRLGEADDIADAVLFLGTESGSYITGQNILVDGGATLTAFAGLRRS